MNVQKILKFLTNITANNNREWFQNHKDEYLECRNSFDKDVEKAILAVSEIDPTVAHLKVKDCIYRFNRDIRFSENKAPYKNHLGAYICMNGRKALCGGYYFHLEKGKSVIAVGAYSLPTNILTACRNEIMANIDEWRSCVENKAFIDFFGTPNHSVWEGQDYNGFGLKALKTCPKDFPRDYEFVHYLKMKDYCAWTRVPDTFFENENWIDQFIEIVKVAKPMLNFINNVVSDYES